MTTYLRSFIVLAVYSTLSIEATTTYMRNTDPQTNKQFPFVEQSTHTDERGAYTISRPITSLPESHALQSWFGYCKNHKKSTVLHGVKIGGGSAAAGCSLFAIIIGIAAPNIDKMTRSLFVGGGTLGAVASGLFTYDEIESMCTKKNQVISQHPGA